MPSRGSKRVSTLRWRNMAQRNCALASFREKYQCPEEGCDRFEISPSIHSAGKPRSSSVRASRLSREGVYTSRVGGVRSSSKSAGMSSVPYQPNLGWDGLAGVEL